jgi:ribulose bisphosphate carboxylase small subunit
MRDSWSLLLAKYYSDNQIKILRWVGHVSRKGERRGVYRIVVRKPEGKRGLERPRSRREDNIIMCLQDIGWGFG